MGNIVLHSPILLLALAFLTLTQGQYYDVYQGVQQFFQPYQRPVDLFAPYNDINRYTGINRQPNRQGNKRRNEDENRYTQKPPPNEYDNNFPITTPKSSRKTTKPYSSQSNKQSNNRNFNTDIIFSDFYTPTFEVTTKRHRTNLNKRTKTTTTAPSFYDINRASTENVLESNIYNNGGSNNFNKPVTENVFENQNPREILNQNNFNSRGNSQGSSQNNRRTDSNIDNNNIFNKVTANNWNSNAQNTNNNNNQNNRFFNNEYNNRGGNNNFEQPTNHRNPDVYAISMQNRPTQNNKNHNFGSPTSSFINTGYNNNNDNRGTTNNRGHPDNFANNRGVLNTDNDGESSADNYNPLLSRPGVKPVRVDDNQPPITNKPVTNNPYDGGFGSYSERPGESPDILIGPDVEDMSEGQKRQYINMAERMCDRYKSMYLKEIVALPLLPAPDPVQVNVSSCVPITAPLVIGGKVASINEFPHMALVGWKKIRSSGYSWKCGGSLISNQYVLTAGHCTYQDKDYEVDSGPPQAVQLGSSYLDDPGALVIPISAVIRHSKYKLRRSYYDIAVIKLAKTVKFSEVIRPACLGVPPSVGKKVIATGWGRTEFGGDNSVELRSVSLPVWNMAECREIWGTSLKLPNGPSSESHMCAGERAGGKDTCQGDSGGPAQIQDGCVWRVVAVTSYGRSCGAPNTPALYAITQRVFVAAVIFGYEDDQGINGRPSFEDRETPSFNNRQTGFSNSRPPTYTVNNYRRQ